MSATRSIAVRAGIFGGLLFSAHISIPGGGNWPFIWPAVAGATAFWMASDASTAHRLRCGLVSALATAAIVGSIGLLVVSLVVFVMGRSQFSAAAPSSNLQGRLSVVVQAESTIVVLCALATIAVICGALVAMPVRWLRHRRSGAPAT